MNSTVAIITPLILPFDADIPMPGSKSHANRALIAAALSPGTTTIRGATPCDDVTFLIRGLQTLGFSVEQANGKNPVLRFRGGIPADRADGKTRVLQCGNAGTAVRFLTALACLVPGEWIITGDEHMQRRPIHSLVTTLRQCGAEVADTDGCPPITIRGGMLRGSSCLLDATKSSQYLTALLLTAPAFQEGLSVTLTSAPASASYLDLTKRVLRDFGVRVNVRGLRYTVKGQEYTAPHTYDIEGDWSAAGAFLILAELTGSRFRSPNLDAASAQGDRALYAVIEHLRAKGNRTIDVGDIPDQLMNLCVLAAHRSGITTFTGAANLRIKESDRLAVIAQELGKAGIHIDEHDDGVTVWGNTTVKPAILDPHDDHRMAMAFAILGSMHRGIRISNPGCVSKSYPRFFHDLSSLHHCPRCIVLVGMRASGKSRLGKKLATKLRLKHLDSDALFEKRHGPIRPFVKRKGWKSFRKIEEELIKENLKPGFVFSLGGGAIESPRTRKLLQRNAMNIFVTLSAPKIVKRLEKEKRPPLTRLPLTKEVPLILRKRTPMYRSIANLTVPGDGSLDRNISHLLSSLRL